MLSTETHFDGQIPNVVHMLAMANICLRHVTTTLFTRGSKLLVTNNKTRIRVMMNTALKVTAVKTDTLSRKLHFTVTTS